MRIGDLVMMKNGVHKDVGIVCVPFPNKRPSHYSKNSSYIVWNGGDRCWYENRHLEVINGSR
jgi:hypothetical protein